MHKELLHQELVMYTRTSGCPYVSIARRVFHEHRVLYREIFIDHDPAAQERMLDWVGFLSVPTLVVANMGEDLPMLPPTPLERGSSPRGIDRGAMLTEPTAAQLTAWLKRHGFITA
ncbi:MAG: glutaredoxin family protein [Armatimonadetes bacterium]|nr:glutaredoxin family protein [Anaerolineae bacterium]